MVIVVREPGLLSHSVEWYQTWFQNHVVLPVSKEIPGAESTNHGRLAEYSQRLHDLGSHLQRHPSPDGFADVPPEMFSLLKRALVERRLHVAREVEALRRKTHAGEILDALDARIRVFDKVFANPELRQAAIAPAPRMTDFLTIQTLEHHQVAPLEPRFYDEKFHTLWSPNLFVPDLRYYRERVGQRGGSVFIGFMDVDNLKAVNSAHTEIVVDASVFPRFLSEIESHFFGHGHAYRFGGDEYAVLLPNMDAAMANESLFRLQDKLAELDYSPLDVTMTVSIGAFRIEPDCFLTEEEALSAANKAKAHAKAQGKDCIALATLNLGEQPTFEVHRRGHDREQA